MREVDVAFARGLSARMKHLFSSLTIVVAIVMFIPSTAFASGQLATPAAPTLSQASPTSVSGNFTPDPSAVSSTVNLYDGATLVQSDTDNISGTFSFSGLITGDTYSATVTSIGDGSDTTDSLEGPPSSSVTLTLPQLAQPAAPSLSQTTPSSITVTFTPNPNATSSTITLTNTTTSSAVTHNVTTPGSFDFTGLTTGDTYSATVTSIGDGVNFATSDVGTASAPLTLNLPQLPRPAAPSLSQTTPSSITVTFTPNPNATSSTITLTNTTTSSAVTHNVTTPGSFDFTGLTTGDTYSATITSIGDGVNFATSDVGTASAPLTLNLPQLPRPAAPSLSQTTPSSITVTFTTNPNAVSSTVTLTNTTTNTSLTNPGNTTGSSTFTGLTPSDTYDATITSIGDGVNYSTSPIGTASAPLTLNLPQLAQPAAPTLSQTTPSSITVTFTPDPNAVSSTVTFNDTNASSTKSVTGNTTGTATFTELTTGDTFTATITSIGDGENFASSPVGVTSAPLTLALIPLSAPQISSTTASNTSVAVSFPSVPHASSYVATVSSGTTVISSNSATCTSSACVVTGLTLGTNYTVSVTAVGDHVTYTNSTPSTSASFVTTSAGPTDAAPPSGVAPSSLGTPVSATASTTAPTTISLVTANTSSTIVVPAGALPAGTTVSAYPITSITALASLLPGNRSYVVAVAVSWETATNSSPTASQALTLTITDVSIVAGDVIYVVTTTGLVLAGTASTNGTATLTFTTDPVFIVTAVAKGTQTKLVVNTAKRPVSHSISLSTKGGSGNGAVAYSVIDGTAKGCTITRTSPFMLSAKTFGTCLVTAIKAADSDFGAVSSLESTITFTALKQKLLSVSSAKGTVKTALKLTTSGGSGTGVVTFQVKNGTGKGCVIHHATAVSLTSNAPGTCLVRARKAADATYAVITSKYRAIRFSASQVQPLVTSAQSQISGGATSSIVLTGTGLGGSKVSTTTKGVVISIVKETSRSITLSVRVAATVRSGVYNLIVKTKSGDTTTSFLIVAAKAVNVAALVSALFSGYRAAWAISPTDGIIYAYTHDYPGSATSESAFLACYQKAGSGQTGETDTPVLSSLDLTPTWRGVGPDTQAWNFAGKKPGGQTYSVIDNSTSQFSNGPTQTSRSTVHVTILNGVAYFYFVPDC